MKSALLLPIALLSACAPPIQQNMPARANDGAFASAYALFVGSPEVGCIYSLTDTGTANPRDVTERLIRNGYDLKRGIEILYDEETAVRCIAAAEEAATSAGFVNVRSRIALDKDRFHGIP
ncbi:MAG: hypothetical protein ABIT16_12025 [Croceibacterium sp.]